MLIVWLSAVVLLALFSTSIPAQTALAYPAIVHAYRSFDRDAVVRLRALATNAIEDAVTGAADGKPQPWRWADLRGAGMLHTEAWYLAREERAADEAARHLLLAERLQNAEAPSHDCRDLQRRLQPSTPSAMMSGRGETFGSDIS